MPRGEQRVLGTTGQSRGCWGPLGSSLVEEVGTTGRG